MADSNHKPFIFAGTESDGLLRSAPGEASYQQLTNGLPEEPQVRALVAHPSNSSRIYAEPRTVCTAVTTMVSVGKRWTSLNSVWFGLSCFTQLTPT